MGSARPWLLHSVRLKGREEHVYPPREDLRAQPQDRPARKDSPSERHSQGPQSTKRRASWTSSDVASQGSGPDPESTLKPPAKRPTLQDVRLAPSPGPRAEEEPEPPASALPAAYVEELPPGAPEAGQEDQEDTGEPRLPGQEQLSCQGQFPEGSEDPRGTEQTLFPSPPRPTCPSSVLYPQADTGNLPLATQGCSLQPHLASQVLPIST